jgi:hypothetical protein
MAAPWTSKLTRALAGVLVALVALALLEGALRLAGLPDPGLYDGDPASVWWLKPGLERELPGPDPGSTFLLRTNALGLRGELPPPEGPWTLALGCSTTLGWGVQAEEAWPSLLEERLGEPVVNGGQPGWSTHQAAAAAGRWLELGPSRVILGYLVRDAQLAPQPDHLARPTPWIHRTRIARGLIALRPRRGGAPSGGTQPRVPVERYVQNLELLVERARPAEVWLLAFPQREPSLPYRAALEARSEPLIAPVMPHQAFFERDPIHLTPEGHRLLARAVAGVLRVGEGLEPAGD